MASASSAAASTTSPTAAVTKPFISARRSSYHFWELLSIPLGSPSFPSSAISHRRTFIALRRLRRVPSHRHCPLFSATLAPALVPISGPAINPTTLSPVVSSPLLQVVVDRFHQNREPITLFPLLFSFLCFAAIDQAILQHTTSDVLLQPISLPTSSRAPAASQRANRAPMAGNTKVDSVADALHSATDLFCNRSSPSSMVLSPQPRAMLPDLLEGAISCFLPRHRSISCFLPRHRSIGRGNLLLPPLNTDLRSLCGLVRLHDSTALGRVWQPPEPNELLLLLLQRFLEEPQSFSLPASKRQWTYRFLILQSPVVSNVLVCGHHCCFQTPDLIQGLVLATPVCCT
ncbi:hypothetical protein BHE74_00056469 [Ensete ventricosum]|nr:hypothetical protein BHE74_00056469 [Ensete ventricosum]